MAGGSRGLRKGVVGCLVGVKCADREFVGRFGRVADGMRRRRVGGLIAVGFVVGGCVILGMIRNVYALTS